MIRSAQKVIPVYLLVKEFVTANKKRKNFAIVSAFLIVLVWISSVLESLNESKTIQVNKATDFKDSRLISNSYGRVYRGKERILEKKMDQIINSHLKLQESIKLLKDKTNEIEVDLNEKKNPIVNKKLEVDLRKAPETINGDTSDTVLNSEKIRVHQQAMNYRSSSTPYRENGKVGRSVRRNRTLISFPVKSTRIVKKEGVVLPSGSYVKAKMMTGIEAPEGKNYPVLLQLDFAHIIPNDKKLDLVGCFMIAKASGSLSTERVEMQAVKLSCVSKTGKMFERKINGFTADGGDNSFGVIGKVNSKQDRVAAMAFLSSVVEGVGKAIQLAQTTSSTNGTGGSQSVITASQAKYIGAGGVGNAAGQVTQWYLKQAQNLLPTINVGSGRDVWIVMADKVELPKEYFKQSRSFKNESVYSYFTNILY